MTQYYRQMIDDSADIERNARNLQSFKLNLYGITRHDDDGNPTQLFSVSY